MDISKLKVCTVWSLKRFTLSFKHFLTGGRFEERIEGTWFEHVGHQKRPYGETSGSRSRYKIMFPSATYNYAFVYFSNFSFIAVEDAGDNSALDNDDLLDEDAVLAVI